MREEETEQADLRFPCETLETVLNRKFAFVLFNPFSRFTIDRLTVDKWVMIIISGMLLEINDCNCVVFCSAFEGAKVNNLMCSHNIKLPFVARKKVIYGRV